MTTQIINNFNSLNSEDLSIIEGGGVIGCVAGTAGSAGPGGRSPWSGWPQPSQSRPCSCPGLSNPSFYLSLSRLKIYPLLPRLRRFKTAVGVDRDVGKARRF